MPPQNRVVFLYFHILNYPTWIQTLGNLSLQQLRARQLRWGWDSSAHQYAHRLTWNMRPLWSKRSCVPASELIQNNPLSANIDVVHPSGGGGLTAWLTGHVALGVLAPVVAAFVPPTKNTNCCGFASAPRRHGCVRGLCDTEVYRRCTWDSHDLHAANTRTWKSGQLKSFEFGLILKFETMAKKENTCIQWHTEQFNDLKGTIMYSFQCVHFHPPTSTPPPPPGLSQWQCVAFTCYLN